METARTPGRAGASPPAADGSSSRRSLAPDLARGVMLLVIATAHAHMFAQMSGAPGHGIADAGDRIATGAMTLFADLRGYPMFAALFGYGLARIHRRRTEQGREWPWTRKLLRRRGLWMIAFGAVHAALLFFGDILAVYGLLALAFTGALRLSDRGLLRAAWAALAVAAASLLAFNLAVPPGPKPEVPEGVTAELFFRLSMWPFLLVFMLLATAFPFLIGMWAGRRRLLERPGPYLPLLRRTAVIGIPVAVAGGLPQALVLTGAWADPSGPAAAFASTLHQVSGFAGGFGYAALIALAAARISAGRPGPVATALAALGRRSLTFYLLQSVAWAVLFASYGFGLEVSTAAGVAIGTAVWAATVVLAGLMHRAEVNGPAETVLRRLAYGPSGRAD
ncbi:DUF418 domain-containing protein [Nocardiopsis potens]|uniref:DUF418 domain-containing protein n=1 Tax=Nocardiopsis potens TaxID=1246458 RepID=UPI000348D007|nr:DUF418 domain-containing protein [Nocardiopsis potens]